MPHAGNKKALTRVEHTNDRTQTTTLYNGRQSGTKLFRLCAELFEQEGVTHECFAMCRAAEAVALAKVLDVKPTWGLEVVEVGLMHLYYTTVFGTAEDDDHFGTNVKVRGKSVYTLFLSVSLSNLPLLRILVVQSNIIYVFLIICFSPFPHDARAPLPRGALRQKDCPVGDHRASWARRRLPRPPPGAARVERGDVVRCPLERVL